MHHFRMKSLPSPRLAVPLLLLAALLVPSTAGAKTPASFFGVIADGPLLAGQHDLAAQTASHARRRRRVDARRHLLGHRRALRHAGGRAGSDRAASSSATASRPTWPPTTRHPRRGAGRAACCPWCSGRQPGPPPTRRPPGARRANAFTAFLRIARRPLRTAAARCGPSIPRSAPAHPRLADLERARHHEVLGTCSRGRRLRPAAARGLPGAEGAPTRARRSSWPG